MKYGLLAILAVTIYLGVSCSPVHFAELSHNCSLSSPCVTSQGFDQVTQNFPFNTTNQVDVLVVDDNSGSMTTEQENLGTPFNGFINGLNQGGLNWQVAVTNTDICPNPNAPAGFCPGPSGYNGAQGLFMGPLVSGGPQYGSQFIITPNTPNGANYFHSVIQRGGEIGSGDERGIYAVNLAITNSANSAFFRSNSNLAVVILSDENERSTGGNCTDTDPADPGQYNGYQRGQCDPGYAPLESSDMPQTLIDNVNNVWGGQKKLTAYSIIVIPDDMTTYPDPNDGNTQQTCLTLQSHQGPYYTTHPGALYQQLSQMTGGLVGSICDNGAGAFQSVLNSITGDIVNSMNSNVITLAYPAISQPTVTFTPTSGAVSWTWNGSNQITLATRPPNGTTVGVNYTYNP